MLSAQQSANGIPEDILEQKKQELLEKKVALEFIFVSKVAARA